jgi:histidinol-phosphate/aromatic aminotransferase/cobyric acid decarboxylase-like protein
MSENGLLPSAPPIEALEQLDELWEIRNAFQERFGFRPENVSHWNPKHRCRTLLENLLPRRELTASIAEYLYSYDVKSHADVLKALGEPTGRGCLFTPSGTTSIVNVLAYLRNTGVSKIAAVRPYYFCFEEFARFCGLQVHNLQLRRTSSTYELPDPGEIWAGDYKAVWLTTPVYCASVYFDEGYLTEWLEQLNAREIIVVADESLAWTKKAIVRRSPPSSC